MSLAPILSSCAGNDGDRREDVFSTYHGVYSLDSFTRNEDGCDEEGPPYPYISDTLLVATTAGSGILRQLAVLSCKDVSDCHDKADRYAKQESVGTEILFWFTEAPDQDHLANTWEVGGEGPDGCWGGIEEPLLSRQGGSITIEDRQYFVEYAPDEDGICWSDTAADAAEGAPCTRLDVVQATRVE